MRPSQCGNEVRIRLRRLQAGFERAHAAAQWRADRDDNARGSIGPGMHDTAIDAVARDHPGREGQHQSPAFNVEPQQVIAGGLAGDIRHPPLDQRLDRGGGQAPQDAIAGRPGAALQE